MIAASEKNADLNIFLQQLKDTNCSYELGIEYGKITNLYVRVPDDGNWGKVWFGRIFGSKVISYIQTTYRPRIVDGKFIYDYNEEDE